MCTRPPPLRSLCRAGVRAAQAWRSASLFYRDVRRDLGSAPAGKPAPVRPRLFRTHAHGTHQRYWWFAHRQGVHPGMKFLTYLWVAFTLHPQWHESRDPRHARPHVLHFSAALHLRLTAHCPHMHPHAAVTSQTHPGVPARRCAFARACVNTTASGHTSLSPTQS